MRFGFVDPFVFGLVDRFVFGLVDLWTSVSVLGVLIMLLLTGTQTWFTDYSTPAALTATGFGIVQLLCL